MTTQLPISFAVGRAVRKRRENMRDKIVRFFTEYPGKKVPSSVCHSMFGTGFRTRCSEINRGRKGKQTFDYGWLIRNEVKVVSNGIEQSYYWAERKQ